MNKFKIIVLYFFFMIISINIKAQEVKFNHYNIDHGLSQNSVTSVVRDNYGFMWFGTEDGLNRFDGYSFKIYKNDPSDSTSLSNNYILDLCLDDNGNLWIATSKGLNKYSYAQDRFTVFLHNPNNKNSLSSSYMDGIDYDKKGGLWIATSNKGFDYFNINNNTFTNYQHNSLDSNSVNSNICNYIYSDKAGNVWISTNDAGLCKYDPEKNKYTRYKHDPNNDNSISNNSIYRINEDLSGKIWVSTKEGLNCIDPKKNEITRYCHNPDDHCSIGANWIYEALQDKYGDIWIATAGGGLNKFDVTKNCFTKFKHKPNIASSIHHEYLNNIYKDRYDNLWIGSYGGGVDRYNPESKKFSHFLHDSDNKFSLVNNEVFSIHKDHKGIIWVGTQEGLSRYDHRTGDFTNLLVDQNFAGSAFNDISAIYEDSNKNLWIGTFNGVYKLDRNNNTFVSYKHKLKTGKLNQIWKIYEDSNNSVWFSARHGIGQYNREDDKIEYYEPEESKKLNTSLSFDVRCIFEDSNNTLWAATFGNLYIYDRNKKTAQKYEGKDGKLKDNIFFCIHECKDEKGEYLWIGTENGLIHLNTKTGDFDRYIEKDGLPNPVIFGILEDDHGNLWLSTNNNLSKLDRKTMTFRNYDKSDGLQSNEFRYGSYFKDNKGFMYMGGINGFNIFHPDSIKDNDNIPQIAITNFSIFNKQVKIGEEIEGEIILKKSILMTDKIEISYKQNVFSFEFAAFNYEQTHKNQYAYKMDGLNSDWIQLGTKNYVSFNGVPPGEYVFRVKGSNNDGYWNEKGVSVKIIITPPFWQTTWFRILVILFITLSVVSFYKIRMRNIKKQKENLEYTVVERTHEIVEKNIILKNKTEEILTQNEELIQHQEEIITQKDAIQRQNIDLAIKNDNIRASIRYALTIQKAILPTTEKLKLHLDCFVVFRPKDIISGDFYWFSHRPETNSTFVAAADCTGHGVPGAFMSLIGNSILNKIINEKQISDPAEILNELNKGIKTALQQEQTDNTDGMDICLCRIKKLENNTEIVFSGAKRPLHIYKTKTQQLEYIGGTRKCIGGFKDFAAGIKFENNEILLSPGDIIYLSTDGFIDQNNEARKRFGMEKFLDIITENAINSLQIQKVALELALDEWQTGTEQRDDITVLGIRV